jgi:hypothetical protein
MPAAPPVRRTSAWRESQQPPKRDLNATHPHPDRDLNRNLTDPTLTQYAMRADVTITFTFIIKNAEGHLTLGWVRVSL